MSHPSRVSTLTLLGWLTLVTACGIFHGRQSETSFLGETEPVTLSPAEHAVLAAVLRDIVASAGRPLYLVRTFDPYARFRDSAAAWWAYEEGATRRFRSPGIYGLPRTLYAAFLSANDRAAPVPRDLARGLPLKLASWVSMANGPEEGFAIFLSRAGLNVSHDSALVHTSVMCQGLCGTSEILLYVLSDSGWYRGGTLVSAQH